MTSDLYTAVIYALVRQISVQQTSDFSPSRQSVASQLGLAYSLVDKLCREIASNVWDYRDGRGHPWLALLGSTVRVTSDGYQALIDARGTPWVSSQTAEWINRHRWPWREEDSRRRAVVPTGSTVHGRRPSDRPAALERVDELAKAISAGDLRYCPRCASAGRIPYRPIESFRHHGRYPESYCKDCQRERATDYRRRKNESRD